MARITCGILWNGCRQRELSARCIPLEAWSQLNARFRSHITTIY